MSFIAAIDAGASEIKASIFDLHGNRGGDPKTVQLLASYLFDNESVLLNNIYTRSTNSTQQYWTLKKIDGERMPNTPVYILTGSMTFSAGEEFTYDLQSLGRAVVVGENDILNKEGLRFKDEFVRHKILDSIGDLYLAGYPVEGYFYGRKSGHFLNNKLLRKLLSDEQNYKLI